MSEALYPAAPAPMGAPRSRRHPGSGLLATACGAQVLEVLSVTVVIVALPVIGDDLALEAGRLSLVVGLYAVAYASLLLLAGRAVDSFGARRIFLLGLAVTLVGVACSALAPTGTALLVARAVQGCGGAMVTPAALALLTARFPAGAPRRVAMAWWTAAAAGGGAAGFGLGGLLLSIGGWRLEFAFIAVLAGVVLAAAPWTIAASITKPDHVPIATRHRSNSLDVLEAVSLVSGLVLLVLGTGALGEVDGASSGWQMLAAGLLLLVVFVFRLRRTRGSTEPLLPAGAFKSRPFLLGATVSFLNTASVGAAGTVCALIATDRLDLGPAATGLVLLPFSAAVVLGSATGTRWLHRPRVQGMVAGLAVSTLALCVIALAGTTASTPAFLAGVCIAGLGLSWTAIASTDAATSALGLERAGTAAAAVNSAAQLGTALGVAVLLQVVGAVQRGGDPDLAHAAALLGAACVTGSAAIALRIRVATLIALQRTNRCSST